MQLQEMLVFGDGCGSERPFLLLCYCKHSCPEGWKNRVMGWSVSGEVKEIFRTGGHLEKLRLDEPAPASVTLHEVTKPDGNTSAFDVISLPVR